MFPTPPRAALAALTALFFCQSSGWAQNGPVSIHTRALVSQYHATNPGEWTDPAGVYFFTPSLGGSLEAVVRYRPDSSRFFFETGLCVWLWNYRAALDTRDTRTQYHNWKAGRGGASAGIPLRVGFAAAKGLDLTAGVLLLQNLSGGTRHGTGFSSNIGGEVLEGEAQTVGRDYTSLAFDLTAALRLSPRFDVLLRGALDTKAYPAVTMQHRITRAAGVQEYTFRGAPKLASLNIGLGFRLL